ALSGHWMPSGCYRTLIGWLRSRSSGAIRSPECGRSFVGGSAMYLGDKKEWNRSLVSRVFPVIINAQTSLQARNAPLEEYVSLLASAPPPMGGSGRDNLTERHLLSHASG